MRELYKKEKYSFHPFCSFILPFAYNRQILY